MNAQMAYLIGMVLGNGEIQRTSSETTITIDIPYKKLIDDSGLEVSVYVRSSLIDIRGIIEPLIGRDLVITQTKNSTKISFTKSNEEYVMREIIRFIGGGVHHKSMVMDTELFDISHDEKKELLRGIADVTGHIRKSNIAFGQTGAHRVYIEIPANWKMVIDIANMLKDLDIPIQSIDFGHPNFRDGNLKKYNDGKVDFWKKEHQLKIYANEFLPVGFNIEHKQRALEKYAAELLTCLDPVSTHKFYWEKASRKRTKPIHPGEQDDFLPGEIRGKHFDSWTELARCLGYHE
ncbi:hypothetical protein CYK73_12685 [Clostridium perfringens]|uniref:hypothetical protein n=1 Tax=Clostridium perfringens TaxID=1502 RepID=UPI000D70E0D8|nr:hypothetical protein [Clostridium perfringens]MCR1963425.1 hypothetical protein [Clostridium perfringens]MDB2046591.1 hypothetical protein [Clostridium perfringens]MDB2056947.1 hypothetical protein [Clostridium perfringens]MDM0934601.1 hypothetical protein [Clostridium perfringens]PWW95181.1 hypothetical protein CYK76_13720 [Clostridium perfringens]